MSEPPRMHPGAVWPLTEDDYEKLDPGIRRLVRLLVDHRFEPTDSGDGKTKLETYGSDFDGEITPFPHVFMHLDLISSSLAEADRLMSILTIAGVKVEPGMISVTYDPADERCILALTGVDDASFGPDPIPRPS